MLCLVPVQLDGHTVVRPSAASAGYSSSLCTVQSKTAGGVHLREDRPALVVSSTSWTPDEDFQVLLDAAVEYDEQVVLCLASVVSQGSIWWNLLVMHVAVLKERRAGSWQSSLVDSILRPKIPELEP